jgi:hypothetical protein
VQACAEAHERALDIMNASEYILENDVLHAE